MREGRFSLQDFIFHHEAFGVASEGCIYKFLGLAYAGQAARRVQGSWAIGSPGADTSQRFTHVHANQLSMKSNCIMPAELSGPQGFQALQCFCRNVSRLSDEAAPHGLLLARGLARRSALSPANKLPVSETLFALKYVLHVRTVAALTVSRRHNLSLSLSLSLSGSLSLSLPKHLWFCPSHLLTFAVRFSFVVAEGRSRATAALRNPRTAELVTLPLACHSRRNCPRASRKRSHVRLFGPLDAMPAELFWGCAIATAAGRTAAM